MIYWIEKFRIFKIIISKAWLTIKWKQSFDFNTGNLDVIKILVEHHVDVNVKNPDEWTPLHAAVEGGIAFQIFNFQTQGNYCWC